MDWVLAPGHSMGCRCDTCHEITRIHGLLAYSTDTSEYRRIRALMEEWRQAAGVEAGLRREFQSEAIHLRAALDRIATHPQCDRVIKQIALDALEGKTEGFAAPVPPPDAPTAPTAGPPGRPSG